MVIFEQKAPIGDLCSENIVGDRIEIFLDYMPIKTCFISFKGNFVQIFTLKATTKAQRQQSQIYEKQTFRIKIDAKSPKSNNM